MNTCNKAEIWTLREYRVLLYGFIFLFLMPRLMMAF
jgi:hypothetical protein